MRWIALAALGLVVCGCPAESPKAATAAAPSVPTGSLSLEPEVSRTCETPALVELRVAWETSGTPRSQIRIDAPDGALFVNTQEAKGAAPTEKWVREGTTFYLMAVPRSASEAPVVLATKKAQVLREPNCP